MKKRLIFMLSVLLSALSATWAQTETPYSPTSEICFRTGSGNTAWNSGYPKDAADDGNTIFEGNYNAGIFTLQKYTVPDLANATKLVLTLTWSASNSGTDAIRLWSFPTNDWTATSSVDDMVNYATQVVGVAPRSSEGTVNTSYLVQKGTTVAGDPKRATFTISGSALTTLKANASSDGTFTLMLTDGSLTSSSSRKYLSNNSANDEANRPTLVATTTAPAPKTAKIVGGDEYETLAEAFAAAVAADADATIEVSGDQKLTARLTWNKAHTLNIVPTANITIKGPKNTMWFLVNTNNATLNIGSASNKITFDGISDDRSGSSNVDVTRRENTTYLNLTNIEFKDFVCGANHLVSCKNNGGAIMLENITMTNCSSTHALIDNQRVSNDALVLKGYLNVANDCSGLMINNVANLKGDGTTEGRIKVDDDIFTASNPLTISWVSSDAEKDVYVDGASVVVGVTSADIAMCFTLSGAPEGWTMARVNNDLKLQAPVVPTAKIGETTYVDLAAALAAVQDGETITLLDDQEVSSRINVKDMTITIDGGNFSIKRATTYTNGLMFLTQSKTADTGKDAELILKNVIIDGQNVEATAAIIEASNNGTTTLNNVTFQNVGGTKEAIINKTGGKLVLKGNIAVPSIFVGKSGAKSGLKVYASEATIASPIALTIDNGYPYVMIVEGGKTSDFTATTYRLSQQPDGVYAMPLAVTYSYSHPALLHTDADIARVKGLLTQEPYASAYSALETASGGTAAGAVEWLKRMDQGNWSGIYGDYANFSRLVTDAKLAYYLALRYQLKGSTAAATAAVNILNDWAENCKGILRLDGYTNNIPDPNEYLILIQAYQLANAAELVKGYAGFEEAKFNNWMKETFADLAILFLENHHGNANALHYWLNWDLAALNTLVSVGVLTNDQALVNYALNYVNNGEGTGNKANAIVATHSDTDSGETLAQCQESGRDQGHATLDVTLMGVLCQMAQNATGTDLFTPYQALEMAEYVGKYNLKNDAGSYAYNNVPFTTYNNGEVTHTAISSDARGTVRPSWELFYAYAKNNGKAARYSQMWADQARTKNAGGETVSAQNDELGFGTLMFYDAGDAADYSYTLSVSDAGAATLILPFDATIPAGVEVYTLNYTTGASAAQATKVETTLPANTPVLVIADEGDYDFTGASIWQKAATMSSDALTGVYQKTIVPTGSYILTKKNDKVGFRKADGSTNTVEANRAYLTATGASAPMLSINFGGGTTGIADVRSQMEEGRGEYYNLNGQRVAQPNKGLYIINGKKMVVK